MMGLFLFAAVALVGLTVLLLLRPWQRPSADPEAAVREVNAGIYRDQLAELDRDLAAGTLAPADHAQARAELQRRLLADTAIAPAPQPSRPARHTALWLALVLPLGATGLYALLGQPAALLPQAATQAAGPGGSHEVGEDQIMQMVDKLAARLKQNPDDPKGWAMLARSYHAMGRLPEAEEAFQHVGDALNKDPALLSAYADVLASRNGGQIEGKPMELVRRALELDPNYPMALSLAATAAYKRQDFAQAAQHWQRLLDQLPPDSEDAKWLVKTLAEIGAPARPASGAVAAAGPAASAARAAPAAAAGGKTVSGTVTLSAALAAQARPDDTVYVFARPADGSRMPLAVQRARVSDLPLQFKLDDSMAISPQAKLSDASQVRIEARVSRSGKADPAAGDLFGMSPTVPNGASQVALQIDQVRP